MSRKWDNWFMGLARYWATASKDPSTKVGAVIVDNLRIAVGHGYNGFPRGVHDTPEILDDRPAKYARTVHAEANAILNAVVPVRGATLYCTHAPCSSCTALIIQAGIERVVYPKPNQDMLERWGDSFKHSRTMMMQAGIEFREIPS